MSRRHQSLCAAQPAHQQVARIVELPRRIPRPSTLRRSRGGFRSWESWTEPRRFGFATGGANEGGPGRLCSLRSISDGVPNLVFAQELNLGMSSVPVGQSTSGLGICET